MFIFTDDQDYHHGSLDHMPDMPALQKHLLSKGVSFTNHYATIAVCCPSRVSLMRGQAAHNTNNTAVTAGTLILLRLKRTTTTFLLTDWYELGIRLSYCYVNKWRKPLYYEGWQQLDVLRIKSLARLQKSTSQKDHDPFFLMMAPSAPHVENLTDPPTPPSRYLGKFSDLTVPYRPNFNQPDELHQDRPSWWAGLLQLNSTQLKVVDLLYQRRSETMLAVDDIIADVVFLLEQKGELDNTYIIFSTDQGYHLGTHRDVGKRSHYIENANIPLVVCGPNLEQGAVSHLPSTVTDFAPTFLDIAGLANEDRPAFLDGTSMLAGWENPHDTTMGKSKEAINVEFWGRAFSGIPIWTGGDGRAGSTDDTELFNSIDDPYELTNLANSTDSYIQRVKSRLNALLMFLVLTRRWTRPMTVFFAAIPQVTILECVQYQYAPNELPFFPPEAQYGLGLAHRAASKLLEYPDVQLVQKVPYIPGGSWEQRSATLEVLMAAARELTADELQQAWTKMTCNEG
ncbi:arylsulfatase [Camillea tinctor]|nr:arylsulfatase [Camillea tinctor]